jgi:hypothetical protein
MQTPSHRRALANSLALKQGLPVTQAAIDARWSGIVAQLNASLPTSRTPIGAGRTSPAAGSVKPSQGDIAAVWSSIVADLNKQAGLTPPARSAR